MRGLPDIDSMATFYTHAPAANTAATQTVAAVAGVTHVLDWLAYSYDGAPAATKTVTMTFGGTAKWKMFAHTAGPQYFRFPHGIYGSENQAVVVTVPASGDGAVSGKVNFGLRAVKGTPDVLHTSTFATATSSGDGVITAVQASTSPGETPVIDYVHYSIDEAVAIGPLVIYDNADVYFSLDIVDGQPAALEFLRGYWTGVNADTGVSLNPSAGDKAILNFGYH